MRSLLAMLIVGAALLVGACNSSTTTTTPGSSAAPSVEPVPTTETSLEPEASPSS